jgi:gamma-glutamylputrescine synthase
VHRGPAGADARLHRHSCPGVNAFRRLRKNLTEPVFNSWGYNTRSAALRIPCSDENNRRIEYRLAGADANPYLVVATILTGMLYGLENIDEQDLPEPQQDEPVLPLFQQQAIEVFSRNQYLTDSLGEAFFPTVGCLQALRAGLV